MSQKELNISMVSMLIPSEVPSGSSPSPRACEQSCIRIISHWGCRAQCQGRPPVLTQLHCSVSQIQFTHPLRNTPTRQSSVLAFLRSLERGLIGPRGNPRSTWRNKRWGGRLSGSPRQLVEMCLLISSCCSTSGLRSWDLFSEHVGIRQTRLPPASQLNPLAIWLMIKRVMVYTERGL